VLESVDGAKALTKLAFKSRFVLQSTLVREDIEHRYNHGHNVQSKPNRIYPSHIPQKPKIREIFTKSRINVGDAGLEPATSSM
jgi:hypothetical protein